MNPGQGVSRPSGSGLAESRRGTFRAGGRRRGWKVVHTRGEGVRDLAVLLAAGEPLPAVGDLGSACLAARAEMLVARHLTATDLVKQAVPYRVGLPEVRAVVAAIGTGPHLSLVAEIADRLATVLEVPAVLMAASPDDLRDKAARVALDHAGRISPGSTRVLVRATDVGRLLDDLPAGSLLVLGAPGGSWLQRQFFGAGRRLKVGAPAGAVVVRDAPPRSYQRAEEAAAFGPEMRAADALRLMAHPAVPVARDGRLVGMVRGIELLACPGDAPIGTVMEPPVSVPWDAPAAAAAGPSADLGGAPVPVVGPEGELIGVLSA